MTRAIYCEDERLWTSAGVTAGIDLALGMIERDHGRPLADEIARRLVLYARRPGHQSQFADTLVAQTKARDGLQPAVDWVRSNVDAPLSVDELARHAGMSVRTFHRRCVDAFGKTPAKLVEGLRMERAKLLLSTTQLSQKEVAARCGLRDGAQLGRSFERAVGLAPRTYRSLHARASATSS